MGGNIGNRFLQQFYEILPRINAACVTTCMSEFSCNIFHSHVQCSCHQLSYAAESRTAFCFEQHSSLKQ